MSAIVMSLGKSQHSSLEENRELPIDVFRSTGFRVRIRRQEHSFKVFEADVLLAEIGHSCSDGGGGEGIEECSNDNGKFHDDIFVV